MPSHSVRLKLNSGTSVYISPNRARRLLKAREARIVSEKPFVLHATVEMQESTVQESSVQRWTSQSDRLTKMSGSFFERNPPLR